MPRKESLSGSKSWHTGRTGRSRPIRGPSRQSGESRAPRRLLRWPVHLCFIVQPAPSATTVLGVRVVDGLSFLVLRWNNGETQPNPSGPDVTSFSFPGTSEEAYEKDAKKKWSLWLSRA